jgi:hypothetical protein
VSERRRMMAEASTGGIEDFRSQIPDPRSCLGVSYRFSDLRSGI